MHNNIDLILSFFLNPEIFKNLKVPSALKTYKLKSEDVLKKNSMVLWKPFLNTMKNAEVFRFFFLLPYIRKHCFYICIGLKLPDKNLQYNSPVLKNC